MKYENVGTTQTGYDKSDRRPVISRVAQAKAVIGQSKAALAQSQANLKLAELNVGRSRELERQGIVAKADGDDKQATYEVRQADVLAMKAAITSAAGPWHNAIMDSASNPPRMAP